MWLKASVTRRFLVGSFSSAVLLDSVVWSTAANSISARDDEKLFQRSGNDEFDRALIAELKRILKVFEVNPGFQYSTVDNCYWISESLIPGTTDGTVILGLPLIRRLMAVQDGGASVAGVCAHECAHIYQGKAGIRSVLISDGDRTIIRVELHADFLAGYYMGRRKEFVPDNVDVFSKASFAMGDTNFANRNHHGTPEQRADAVRSGYKVALDGESLAQASKLGIDYVMKI